MASRIGISKQIQNTVEASLKAAVKNCRLPELEIPAIAVDVPKNDNFGDFSVNIAMQLAKPAKMNPRVLAGIIIGYFDFSATFIDRAEIAGPGFINFYLKTDWLYDELKTVIAQNENYGKTAAVNKKILVEYVSANPTGPLHLGNARGGAVGDVLANVYTWAGWQSDKEFYLNDAGNQITKFGESLSSRYMQLFDEAYPFPEDGYQGDDIKVLAKEYFELHGGGLKDAPCQERIKTFIEYGLDVNIAGMQDVLSQYKIKYDNWFRESSLYSSGAVAAIVDELKQKGAAYEKDGAIWFKATDYGCEKDEVLLRQNGVPTYFAADIAYHYDKLVTRGYDLAVDVWGADHHGHIQRLKMALKALDINPERFGVVLMQLVHLLQNDAAVRMSKRKGDIVTLGQLIAEVGCDAARFIFNMYAPATHMDFDLELAAKQSNENPVFYVQYAHARIKSILRSVATGAAADYALLEDKSELTLLRKLADFSFEIERAAYDLDPSRITKYAYELATCLHSFYHACRVKTEDETLSASRFDLVKACGIVLKNALTILGVDAPEQM